MIKKNPYSHLDYGAMKKNNPNRAKRLQTLLESKAVHPAQFHFFVDGFNFFLRCQKEAERHADYVQWLFENWSDDYPTPDVKIDARVLAGVGRTLLYNAQSHITEQFIEMGKEVGHAFVSASDVFLAALWDDKSWMNREIEKVKDASAILDSYYIVDLFAAKPPSTKAIKRKISDKLKYYRGQEGDSGWRLLEENLELADERKVKNRFGRINDIGKYEQFIDHFNQRGLDRTNLAINRYDIGDDGGFWLKEKGVDAMLIMGMFDAKNDRETDAICLFSNDSDFYPVLQRIKEDTTRPLFLAVIDDGKPISKMLEQSVGEESVIKIKVNHNPSWPNWTDRDLEVYDGLEMTVSNVEAMDQMQEEMDASWASYETMMDAEFEARWANYKAEKSKTPQQRNDNSPKDAK